MSQGSFTAANSLKLTLPVTTTGSYGCVVKVMNQSRPSIIAELLKNPQTMEKLVIYRHVGGGNTVRKEAIDTRQFLKFIGDHGCALAVKIFRASFKDPTKTSESAFRHELSKVLSVKSAIGDEHFYTYTTYRFFEGACAFSIEATHGASIKLYLSHKPDFKEQRVDALYFMLQEACACSIDKMLQPSQGMDGLNGTAIKCGDGNGVRLPKVDAHELDKCIGKILRILHEAEVAHRDIKPQNIVYCPFSFVKYKLVDYAFAERLQMSPAGAPPIMSLAGTRAYMSPYMIGLHNRVLQGDAANQDHINVPKMVGGVLKNKSYAKFYGTLLRAHILSIKRSQRYDDLNYVLLKNDDYAYMLTLLHIYSFTNDKSALAKATILSLSSACFYTDKF